MSFAFAVIKTTKESKIDRTERKQSRSSNHYNHKLPKKATLDRNVFIRWLRTGCWVWWWLSRCGSVLHGHYSRAAAGRCVWRRWRAPGCPSASRTSRRTSPSRGSASTEHIIIFLYSSCKYFLHDKKYFLSNKLLKYSEFKLTRLILFLPRTEMICRLKKPSRWSVKCDLT